CTLQPGDVLVVTRLDRLARSTRDLLNVLATVSEREAGFRSLKDTWTTTPHGRLMLTVLGGLAEFERELIRARTGDGRARAQARGVKFGRPSALTTSPCQWRGAGRCRASLRRIAGNNIAAASVMSKRAALRLANYFGAIGHRVVKIRKHRLPAGVFYRVEFAPKANRKLLRGGRLMLLHLHG